jgi:hypothetical protein
MRPKMAILAACDRFNYGDLVFPVIVEAVLRKYGCQADLDFYSTRASDWSRFGGKPTRSLRALFQPTAMPDGSILLLAGGDILGATFQATVDTLLPAALGFGITQLANRFGQPACEAFCRYLVGVEMELPWIIAPGDFRSRVQVVYNSVGGTGLRQLSSDLLRRVAEKLGKASFLSVRDALTQATLGEVEPSLTIRLAPDCAVLLSHFYPVAELEKLISPHTRLLCDAVGRNYLCFQIGRRRGSAHIGLLTAELEKVYGRHGLATLLLPIGRARQHEDPVPLGRIAASLRTPAVYAGTALTIYDIMYLIARARAFAGTSLHGNITALSYAVPHLGLSENIPKLASFLETWDLPPQQACVPQEGFGAKLEAVLMIPRSELEEKQRQLTRLCLRNFAALFEAVGIHEEPVLAATRR